MSVLILWPSDTTDGAEVSRKVLRDLPEPARSTVHDAALVYWPSRSRTPITRPLDDLASDQVLGDGFWGVLFGLIFYSPLLGAAVVSPTEAFTGSVADFGIADTFVQCVRDAVTPGTSALLVLGSDQLVEHVHAAADGDRSVDLRMTRLSSSQERALREVFVG